MTTVFIGSGAGFAGDRQDAARPVVRTLAKCQGPRFLIFEVMAERTLAAAQLQRRQDPSAGSSPYLEAYLGPVLGEARRAGVRIVTNAGVANPRAAASRVRALADAAGLDGLRIATVTGDDLLDAVGEANLRALEVMEGIEMPEAPLIAANAYLGAEPIVDALDRGAEVVLTGRTTDVALTLGPLRHVHGWAADDWHHLAAGTLAGHLIECGAQVSGGYFTDPGMKDVPHLADVGFPIAEVDGEGTIIVTKAEATGGLVSVRTVKEQLLYEVHDPSAYLNADCVLDLTDVEVAEQAPDRVRVTGARGYEAPDRLKATLCFEGGFLAEGAISYAGPGALGRARLARDILLSRGRRLAGNAPMRADIIGVASVLDGDGGGLAQGLEPPAMGDYRVRFAARVDDRRLAQRLADEVLSLYCSGPAGGGGVRQSVVPQIRTCSVLVPRDWVRPLVELV